MAYTPPAGESLTFAFSEDAYTPPAGGQLVFNFDDVAASTTVIIGAASITDFHTVEALAALPVFATSRPYNGLELTVTATGAASVAAFGWVQFGFTASGKAAGPVYAQGTAELAPALSALAALPVQATAAVSISNFVASAVGASYTSAVGAVVWAPVITASGISRVGTEGAATVGLGVNATACTTVFGSMGMVNSFPFPTIPFSVTVSALSPNRAAAAAELRLTASGSGLASVAGASSVSVGFGAESVSATTVTATAAINYAPALAASGVAAVLGGASVSKSLTCSAEALAAVAGEADCPANAALVFATHIIRGAVVACDVSTRHAFVFDSAVVVGATGSGDAVITPRFDVVGETYPPIVPLQAAASVTMPIAAAASGHVRVSGAVSLDVSITPDGSGEIPPAMGGGVRLPITAAATACVGFPATAAATVQPAVTATGWAATAGTAAASVRLAADGAAQIGQRGAATVVVGYLPAGTAKVGRAGSGTAALRLLATGQGARGVSSHGVGALRFTPIAQGGHVTPIAATAAWELHFAAHALGAVVPQKPGRRAYARTRKESFYVTR